MFFTANSFITIVCYVVYLVPSAQAVLLNLEINQVCQNTTSETWTCQKIKDCPQIGDFKEKRPPICSFIGREPVICCPPDSSAEIARIFCARYTLLTCYKWATNNAKREVSSSKAVFTRVIVGGKRSKPKEHPHMALIGYGEEKDREWLCGGTLISLQFVLSAAHCAQAQSLGAARWVRLGDLDISTTTDNANHVDFTIDEIIVHPEYKEPSMYHDIALFKLDSLVSFDAWIKPACLHNHQSIPRTQATATGWGRTDFGESPSEQLLEVDLTLVDGEQCKKLLGRKSEKIPRGIDPKTMICAGEVEGGKDTCTGDSGGPLVIKKTEECLKYIVGVTSFGRRCALANSPGVYTRVSHYLPWITKTVWPDFNL